MSAARFSKKITLSVDVIERREEAKKKLDALLAKGNKGKGNKTDPAELLTRKPLDMAHVQALADLISYSIFLCFIFCVVFLSPAEYNALKVTEGMNNQLTNLKVSSVSSMWTWLYTVAPAVQQTAYPSGRPFMNESTGEYETLWFGRENLALGRIRLRQLRVAEDNGCEVPSAFASVFKGGCYPASVPGPLDEALTYLPSNGSSAAFASTWKLHRDGYAWYSQRSKVLYPTSGYVEELPLGEAAASARLDALYASGWVDGATRAVFVEASAYNVNVDHFGVARYAFELLPSGLVLPSQVFDSVPLLGDLRFLTGDGASARTGALFVLELGLYAMVLAYMGRAANVAADFGGLRPYLANGWNLLDLLNCGTFLGLVVVRAAYMLSSATLTYDVYRLSDDTYRQPLTVDDEAGGKDYDSYYRVRQQVEMWRVGRNLLAVGVLVNFGRAFKYVRASKRLSTFSETIVRSLPAARDLGFMFLVTFCAFAFSLRLIIGDQVDGYADFLDSCYSVMEICFGNIEDVDALMGVAPLAGPLLFALLILLLVFVMLTLLLKAVDEALTEVMDEQRYEEDRFGEELREAFLLLARDTYWSLTAPIQYYLVARRIRNRTRRPGQSSQHGGGGGGSAAGGGGGAGGGESEGNGALWLGGRGDNRKRGAPPAPAESERLQALKAKIKAKKFVAESEVEERDAVAVAEYLCHRQGVLTRRLKGLKALAEHHHDALAMLDDDDDRPPDEDDKDDHFDPTASLALQCAAAGTTGHHRATRTKVKLVPTKKPDGQPSEAELL